MKWYLITGSLLLGIAAHLHYERCGTYDIGTNADALTFVLTWPALVPILIAGHDHTLPQKACL